MPGHMHSRHTIPLHHNHSYKSGTPSDGQLCAPALCTSLSYFWNIRQPCNPPATSTLAECGCQKLCASSQVRSRWRKSFLKKKAQESVSAKPSCWAAVELSWEKFFLRVFYCAPQNERLSKWKSFRFGGINPTIKRLALQKTVIEAQKSPSPCFPGYFSTLPTFIWALVSKAVLVQFFHDLHQ